MIPDVNLVHILRPAIVPFCDSECERPACREAIMDGTPLLCEAISREDFERAAKNSTLAKLKRQFAAKEIYRFGLAFLVLTTAHENRKKYDPNFLGRAIFAYLRVGRRDDGYQKRIIALLHEVMVEPDHFAWDDLSEMFGSETVEVLKLLLLPLNPENYFLLTTNPTALEVYECILRARVDWAELRGDLEGSRSAKSNLLYLISLKDKDQVN